MGKLSIKINKGVFAKGREAMENGDDYGNVELEPGRYHGFIKKARATEVNGVAKLICDVQIPEAGGKVSLWYTLDEEKIVYLLRDVKKLGYDPESIDSPEALADLIDTLNSEQPAVKISAKRGGEFINTRLEGVLTGAVADEVKAGEQPEVEEKPAKAGVKKVAKKEEAAEEEEEQPAEEEQEEEKPAKKIGKTVKKPVASKEEEEEEVVEEEEEAPAENEKEVEIDVGTKCKATVQGKVQPVEITEVDADNNKVVVKTKDGKKFKIALDKLSL